MKVINKLMKLTAIVAAVFMIAACGSENNNKAAVTAASKDNMLPDNAVVALKVAPEQLLDNIVGTEGSDGYEKLERILHREMGSMAKTVMSYIDEPSKCGLSAKDPMYITMAGDFENLKSQKISLEFCLVAMVDDRDVLSTNIDLLIGLLEKEGVKVAEEDITDTYTYYSAQIDEGIVCDLGLAEKSATLRLSMNTMPDAPDAKESMLQLFAEGGPKSPESIKALYESEGQIAMWMDVENILSMVEPLVSELSDYMDPAQFNEAIELYKDGGSMVLDINFKKGATTLISQLFGSDKLKNEANKYYAVSSDKYYDYLAGNPALALNINIKDLQGLLAALGSVVDEMVGETGRSSMSRDISDAIETLKEFNIDGGQMTGALGFGYDYAKGDYVPSLQFVMDCDEDTWESLSTAIIELNEDTYSIGGNLIAIGDDLALEYMEDQNAAILVDQNTYVAGLGNGGFVYNDFAKTISHGGLVLDISAFPYELLNDLARNIDYSLSGYDLLEYVSSVVIASSEDQMSGSITLNSSDSRHTLLEKMFVLLLDEIR